MYHAFYKFGFSVERLLFNLPVCYFIQVFLLVICAALLLSSNRENEIGVGFPVSKVNRQRLRREKNVESEKEKVYTGVSSYQHECRVYRSGVSNSSILQGTGVFLGPFCIYSNYQGGKWSVLTLCRATCGSPQRTQFPQSSRLQPEPSFIFHLSSLSHLFSSLSYIFLVFVSCPECLLLFLNYTNCYCAYLECV